MPAAIRVMPWPDPVLDVIGHDPRSWYAETFWLPTLGPTALLLLRHLADRFSAECGRNVSSGTLRCSRDQAPHLRPV